MKELFSTNRWRFVLLAFFIVLLFWGANAEADAFNYNLVDVGRASIAERYVSSEAKTLIFFGGAGQRDSAKETIEVLRDFEVLNDWNIIGVAVYRNKGFDVKDWEGVVEDLLPYINQKVEDNVLASENFFVDGLSNGGYGAYLIASLLEGVQEVSFLDAVIAYKIREEEIQSLLDKDIKVNVYAAIFSDYDVSKNGIRLIKAFDGIPGFYGEKLKWSHTNSIVSEIYRLGLHKN